jgi:hypothetical protein
MAARQQALVIMSPKPVVREDCPAGPTYGWEQLQHGARDQFPVATQPERSQRLKKIDCSGLCPPVSAAYRASYYSAEAPACPELRAVLREQTSD